MALKPTSRRTEANRRESRRHHLKTTERGYGWDWQCFRARIVQQRPICEDCLDQGQVRPTEELHHIQKIKDAPDRKLDPDNVRALCSRCHDARTARGE